MALNVRTVESLKPKPTRQEIADGLIPSFYLQIEPTGAKSWTVRYRYGGRSRKYTLGRYPTIDLKTARELASKALRAVAEGRDPARERKLLRSAGADTVASVAALFIERHGRTYRKRTFETVTGMLNRHVLPRWGSRPLAEITRRDVIHLLDDIVDGGSPVSANRVLAVIRRMFTWAIERDIVETSPCVGVRAPTPEVSRDRVLSDAELRIVWLAAEQFGGPYGPYGALIKLLTLTGQRRDEVAGMRWSELLDLDGPQPVWRLPGERTKNHRPHDVPLSRAAVALIQGLPHVGDEFVLTTTGRTPASGFGKNKDRLDALLPSDMPEWRLHDIRRSVATGLARLGTNLPVIEKILNHVGGSFAGVVGVYQRHDYADEKRATLDRWAAHVERLVHGDPATVVPFRGPRG